MEAMRGNVIRGCGVGNVLHWDPHILSLDGPVHEGGVERHVARAHLQPFMPPLQQGHREALGTLPSEESFRVAEVKPNPHHPRHRCERDVPLVEGRPNPYLPPSLLNHPCRADERGGVRSGVRSGQPEAGDQAAVGKAREEVGALLICAVTDEQLARAERVGHGHRGVGVEGVGAQLCEDGRDAVGGEALASPLLGDLHRKETAVAHKVPHLVGEKGRGDQRRSEAGWGGGRCYGFGGEREGRDRHWSGRGVRGSGRTFGREGCVVPEVTCPCRW